MDIINILLILILIVGIVMFNCKNYKSSFGEASALIFYSPGCGHCERAMPEFKKAAQINPGISLIDVTDQNNASIKNKYSDLILGVPTIIRTSDNAVYQGNRKAGDIINFCK